jgi:sulfate/thiosulfate-binding protein
VQRGIGDVLLAWENEAFLALKESAADKLDIVYPSVSVLAEPPVAVVDKFVQKHGTAKLAEAYLQYLYSPEGQEIAARNYYRPRDAGIAAKHAARFGKIGTLATIAELGGWPKVQAEHFEDGGTFDSIYSAH